MATVLAEPRPSRPPARGRGRPYRLTVEQVVALADAGVLGDAKVELRDGRLIESAPPWMPHTRAKARLARRLTEALAAADSDLEVLTEGSVRAGEREMPEPDIFACEPVPAEQAMPARHVRLVVELCDSSHVEDFGRKPGVYGRAGVPEYWIVDLRGSRVVIMIGPGPDGYAERSETPLGESVCSPTLGVAIATDGLV